MSANWILDSFLRLHPNDETNNFQYFWKKFISNRKLEKITCAVFFNIGQKVFKTLSASNPSPIQSYCFCFTFGRVLLLEILTCFLRQPDSLTHDIARHWSTFPKIEWLMTQSTLLGRVRLFLIPQKMDEDSCSQQGPIVSLFWINNQANQQPQLVEHDTVSQVCFQPWWFWALLVWITIWLKTLLIDHQRLEYSFPTDLLFDRHWLADLEQEEGDGWLISRPMLSQPADCLVMPSLFVCWIQINWLSVEEKK